MNMLLYARKSDDVGDILNSLRDCVLHVSNHIQTKEYGHKIYNLYLERWALDALEKHMSSVKFTEIITCDEKKTLSLAQNSSLLLKEWLPEEE